MIKYKDLFIPDHPPKFEKIHSDFNGDSVELTLTYEESVQWLSKNNIEQTENGLSDFYVVWYSYYREKGFRDEFMEFQFKTAWDNN